MKTKSQKNQMKGLSNQSDIISSSRAAEQQPEPAQQAGGPPARVLPFVNFEVRQKSRSLSSTEVLAHLRRWYPEAYALAEVVGAWVWVTFTEQPAENVRAGLSQIGFHWNNHRKCWQHPGGQFTTEGSGADPRQKYGSKMASAARTAADQVAA